MCMWGEREEFRGCNDCLNLASVYIRVVYLYLWVLLLFQREFRFLFNSGESLMANLTRKLLNVVGECFSGELFFT